MYCDIVVNCYAYVGVQGSTERQRTLRQRLHLIITESAINQN